MILTRISQNHAYSVTSLGAVVATPATLERAVVEDVVRRLVLERLGTKVQPGAPTLVVHASARHMHVCREHLDQLFGPGYELTVDRPLYQEGNFAAKETVTLIGPRSRLISNLRILGPLRSRTQVELAFTDAVSLGLEAPIRLSGDLDGTPGAFLMGPQGMVELEGGVIRAARHVHMSPQDAAHYGVEQGDLMKLRVGGDAGMTFGRVQVRIGPDFRLDVHLDTDEANACGLHLTKDIELFK
jgi:putative phosphotransacetylase